MFALVVLKASMARSVWCLVLRLLFSCVHCTYYKVETRWSPRTVRLLEFLEVLEPGRNWSPSSSESCITSTRVCDHGGIEKNILGVHCDGSQISEEELHNCQLFPVNFILRAPCSRHGVTSNFINDQSKFSKKFTSEVILCQFF